MTVPLTCTRSQRPRTLRDVSTNAALAAAATLIALAFAASTFERWLDRRRPHDLAWSVSLLFFFAASAALWLGVAKGWDGATFRVFFLFGAIVNVPWLAIGSVYLLAGPRHGRRWAIATAALSCFAAGVMVVAPTKGPVPVDGLPKGSAVFGVLPRVLAAVASGAGALVVVVGAVWSAVLLARGRSHPGRPQVNNPSRLAVGQCPHRVGHARVGCEWDAGRADRRGARVRAHARDRHHGVVQRLPRGDQLVSRRRQQNLETCPHDYQPSKRRVAAQRFRGFVVSRTLKPRNVSSAQPAGQRSSRRSSLPPSPWGRASTNRILVGHL